MLGVDPLPIRGRARLRRRQRDELAMFINPFIALLNLIMVGGVDGATAAMSPTAAQTRVLQTITLQCRTFLRSAPGTSGESTIESYLRDGFAYDAWVRERTLPLGERAGTPARAATVCLATALQRRRPEVARQVREPSVILLPARMRPRVLRRPYIRLAESYPGYVQRNVRSGLQTLAPLKRVIKHHGKPVVSGAFSVPKDEIEDRAISALCPLNEMIDKTRLTKPLFARIPAMRTIFCSGQRRLLITKRDARRYFHVLKVGRKWNKYLAQPPLPATSKHAAQYPMHRGVPTYGVHPLCHPGPNVQRRRCRRHCSATGPPSCG